MMTMMMMMMMVVVVVVLKGASCSDFRHFSSCHQLESNPSSAHKTDYPNATGVASIIKCLSLYSLVTYLTICVYLCSGAPKNLLGSPFSLLNMAIKSGGSSPARWEHSNVRLFGKEPPETELIASSLGMRCSSSDRYTLGTGNHGPLSSTSYYFHLFPR